MTRQSSPIRRFLRRGAWFFGAVLLVAVLAGVALVIVVRRPFPDYRGTVAVAGLSAGVEILRDEYGVPHIYADSREDLAFGQGYAHAQDRFWQMEFWRRIGAGRLAEILGPDLVETDRYLRTMGFARVAAEEYRRLPPNIQSWLEAYAAGVNAYISSRPPRRLGLEFAVLELTGVSWEIEPWTPVHTLAWAKIMAQDLSKNLGTEIRNLRALVAGSRPLARLIDAPYPTTHPVIVNDAELAAFRSALGIEIPAEPTAGPVAHHQTAPRVAGTGVGSNSWVVGPELTGTGAPLLANDMHLGVQMPSIWYEVGLHLRDGALSLRGYSFPGVPGVIAGQNQAIAWGITNLGGDVQDLFLEAVDPEDPDRYRDGDAWRQMDTRVERIYVQGQARPVEHRVRRTVRGPVISDLAAYSAWSDVQLGEGAGIDRASVTALSLGWPALEPGTIVQAIYGLNGATTYREFRDALRYWDVPGQNLVYADATGTIAYQSTGRHPIRSDHIGQLPARAADGERWEDTIPFDHLPASRNPAKGYIATANNPVTGPAYRYFLGRNFANGYRARRIVEMIESTDGPVDAGRIAAIHRDVTSIYARELLPHLTTVSPERADAAWVTLQASIDHPTTEDRPADALSLSATLSPAERRDLLADTVALLRDWDGGLRTDSPGALAFWYVWSELARAVLADELPGWAWPPLSLVEAETVIGALLDDPDHPVWDDATTDTRETADTILARSLAGGVFSAAAQHGTDPTAWQWGDVHTVTFRNATLGESGIAAVEAMFNRGPYPAPGGPSTVNVAHWALEAPFAATVIASQRAIYDLADPGRSRFIHPTGQSGHPFHRHYDDFIEPWLSGEYHPAHWSRDEVEASAGRRRLELRPR